MAFNDIKAWASILNEIENEKVREDEAIQAAAAKAAQLETDRFNDLDEEQVDINEFGLTDSEYRQTLQELENDENDVIDFSQYGINDNVEKNQEIINKPEVITTKSDTTNIDQLAKAIYDLANKISDISKCNSDKCDHCDDTTVKTDDVVSGTSDVINTDTLELDTDVEITDQMIDDMMMEADDQSTDKFHLHIQHIKDLEDMIEDIEDFPLTDADIKQMKDSTEAIEKIINEPNFNNTKLVAKKLADKVKFLKDKIDLSVVSDDIKDTVLNILNSYDEAIEDFIVPISKTGFSPSSVEYVKNKDGNEHWSVTAPDKEYYGSDSGVPEIHYSGKIPGPNMNRDYDIATDKRANSQAQKRIERNIKNEIAQNERVKRAKDIVLNTKANSRTVEDWSKILNGLTDADRTELLNDLLADPTLNNKGREFINFLFKGKMDKKLQNLFARECGFGSDLKGNTGNVSEVKEKITSYLVTIPADILNIAYDEIQRMRKILRGTTKETRDERKELRKAILTEIFAELGFDLNTVPNYEGPTSEKDRFRLVVLSIISQLFNEGTPDEKSRIIELLKKYDQDSQFRKFKTGLSKEENMKFLELVKIIYDDSLINDEFTEHVDVDTIYNFLRLDAKRVGFEELEAQAKAMEKLGDAETNDETYQKVLDMVHEMARRWLRGGSTNITKQKAKKSGLEDDPDTLEDTEEVSDEDNI